MLYTVYLNSNGGWICIKSSFLVSYSFPGLSLSWPQDVFCLVIDLLHPDAFPL